MRLFPAPALAPALALGLVLAAAGCGGESASPVGPANHRTYKFTAVANVLFVPDDTVEVRTRSGTWRTVTNANGVATLSIPDSVALPSLLLFTGNHPDFLPVGSEIPGAPGTQQNVTMACDAPVAGAELFRRAALVRLGDGVADPGSADAFQVDPDGTELNVTFNLDEIPAAMPGYRLRARGVQCQVELLVNGHSVGGFGPATSSVDANQLWQGQLLGLPTMVFQVGSNTFTLRTSEIRGAPGLLDDFELSALRVALP